MYIDTICSIRNLSSVNTHLFGDGTKIEKVNTGARRLKVIEIFTTVFSGNSVNSCNCGHYSVYFVMITIENCAP